MIRRYLREHLPLAGLLALFAGTFALVLSLYHLPTEPVAYASALCAVMGLIALIWGFVRYRRAHQARAHVLNAPHLLLDELPSPRTLSEADDQAIMQRLLHDIRAAQSDLAAYRQDSTDYFTAWVHQIKTPLSVMRLQLQSEDTPENRAMLAELFQMVIYNKDKGSAHPQERRLHPMKKQPDKGKITALYERLSHDDERAGESVSIENQKRILEDYAQKNGFTNIRHFTDDGVRGTTFKRPGLDAMLEEIRAGNVATVIIKDQSRIGRDVVEVGLLKRTFDEYHVRFIAANDNLDTANGFDIMSIFRDVINEWYVADTSRKIKTVFKSRMEKGLRCSGSVSYGYLASKENKGEWVIDEEAAAVVRRIFHSVVAGESIASIARALRTEKIPIPSEHWKRIGAPVRAAKYTDPYAWSTTTISYILKRPEYTGRKVLGKTVCENYKTKSTRKTAPEEQYIFDGEIPAIVDEETWNTVQRLMGTKRRAPKRQTTPNRLTGLLYCADCGAKLTHRSSLVQGKYLDDAFVCSSYRQLTRDCTMHYIPTAKMEAAILAAIQRVSWYVRHNEAEFIERVREASDQHQENAVKEYRQKVSKAQRRCKELDGLVKKLYEGNATGKIPDKHFTRLLAEYDEEQTKLEAAIAQWEEAIESWNADRLKTDKFIELVSRYTDFSELTTPMLNEFIEKVVVHEGEGRGNSRRQRIDIYLNFIGAFEVPAHIVTPMEAEEQRRQQEEQAAKEAHSQELAKAREEKRKAEKREFTARKKAGLLTPEEQAADEARLAHNRAWQKEWREKRKAAEPPKPPKPKSLKELAALQKAGADLTPEEAERLAAYRERKNRQHKAWYERQKAAQPPKPRTLKELAAAQDAGQPLTPEETERLEASRNRKKNAYQELKIQAETDPVAAAELARRRAYHSEATKKSRQKMYEEAAAGNPEAQARYENFLAARRENYHKKRQDEKGEQIA